MVNFGFVFGFLLGIPVAVVDHAFGIWWLLPFMGVIVGWLTNLLGMALIFEPVEERRILGIKVHGLFLRRQDEVADVYARIIADDVITLENIGDFLLYGPRGDRTQQMLESAMGPAIDRAAGPARAALRVAVGTREFDAIRDQVAHDSAAHTITPFRDPGFSAPAEREDPGAVRRSAPGSSRRATSWRCCGRRSRRTSGCSTPTGPSWDSPAAWPTC